MRSGLEFTQIFESKDNTGKLPGTSYEVSEVPALDLAAKSVENGAMNPFPHLLLIALLVIPAFAAPAQAPDRAHTPAAATPVLPPIMPWDGPSRRLVVPADHPWITPAEASGLVASPPYEETMEWLERLVSSSTRLNMVELGTSPEGRAIVLVIATAEGAREPAQLRSNGRPTVFAQGGIHAGEIDGKDAGMMLLRDLTAGGRLETLLEGVNFLFVPIFNVDGHERSAPFNRINQRGPRETGWRTTSRNLNLNRDYAKADALEMKAMIGALDAWQPDLYLDLHVTDGSDYQYDITYGFNGPNAWSPATAAWLAGQLAPALDAALSAGGHTPGPLVFEVDPKRPERGITGWTASPRFSQGYADARHIGGVLVENHSLKPFDRRVLGTYVLLEATLRTAAAHGRSLRQAIERDRAARPATIPLAWEASPPQTIEFDSIEYRTSLSPITGAPQVEWLGRPVTRTIPFLAANEPARLTQRPRGYWIHPAWHEVIERIDLHGIRYERIVEPRRVSVEMYRLHDPQFAAVPFEGRFPVTVRPEAERREELYPSGSVYVPADQPLGTLAMLLLEPASPDSFLQWGFFQSIFTRTEYIEEYVMEPMAAAMLEESPALREEFHRRLEEDERFRGNPRERLQWFYQRTPFFDERWRLYPVGREID
jgi:murein tripeptide amidase MpaA